MADGGFEMMSLYFASASLGFDFVSFFASSMRAESACAILMYLEMRENDCEVVVFGIARQEAPTRLALEPNR